jgi:hypothetical protein
MKGPSRHYFDALQRTKEHQIRCKNSFTGRFLFRYADHLKTVIDEFECKTLLDFGCGKGEQWRRRDEDGETLAEWLGVVPTLHDPAWPKYEQEPKGTFDIVVCTQVLGCIPEVDIPWFMGRLAGHASEAIFIGQREGGTKKALHNDMKSVMPKAQTAEEWEALLGRSTYPVPVFISFHHFDDSFSLRRIS